MFAPKVFTDNLFDDWFDGFDLMEDQMNRMNRKLYGKHASREMLMDVKENGDHYDVEIDLPGFKKEDISIELSDGVMTVSASKGLSEEDKNREGMP